jgi:hypothetical protein
MSVIEKLKEAVRSVVDERAELYKEARLEDGRVVATEAEEFSAGADVRVLSDDGEAAPLEAGSHQLSDGGEITVDAESKVEMMEDEEEKVEATEEEPDEMAAVKAALVEKFMISDEVAQEIVEVVSAALKPMVEEEVEASEEPKKEEMSMQVEMAHEMATALEAINKRLETLENAPAAEPDRVLAKAEFKKETNPNLSGVDRAYNIISQFS